MTEAAQQRTLEEIRQELLWLQDIVQMALKRLGGAAVDLPKPELVSAASLMAREADDTEGMVEADVIARRMGLTPNIIRKYVRQKSIPFRKLGDSKRPRVRFYWSEVEAYLNGERLRVIDNGVTLESTADETPSVNPRQGQPVKRTPQLKRRLSYTR